MSIIVAVAEKSGGEVESPPLKSCSESSKTLNHARLFVLCGRELNPPKQQIPARTAHVRADFPARTGDAFACPGRKIGLDMCRPGRLVACGQATSGPICGPDMCRPGRLVVS